MLFTHGPIPSLENCIFDSVFTQSILNGVTKGLVMNAYRVGVLISCTEIRGINVCDIVSVQPSDRAQLCC